MNKKTYTFIIASALALCGVLGVRAANPATSVPQIGGDVHVVHANGSGYWLNATTSSDVGRGVALLTAWGARQQNDRFVLASSTFNILGAQLAAGCSESISITGGGMYSTVIQSTAGGSDAVIRALNNSIVEDLTIQATSTTAGTLPYGSKSCKTTNAILRNVHIAGTNDGIYFQGNDNPGNIVLTATNVKCESLWDCTFFRDLGTYYIYDSVLTATASTSVNSGFSTDALDNNNGGVVYAYNVIATATGGSINNNAAYNTGTTYISGGRYSASGAGTNCDINRNAGLLAVTSNTVYSQVCGTPTFEDNFPIRRSLGSNGTSGQILQTDGTTASWVGTSTIGLDNFFTNSGATTTLAKGSNLAAGTLQATSSTGYSNLAGGLNVGGATPLLSPLGTFSNFTVYSSGAFNGSPSELSFGGSTDSATSREGTLRLDVTSNGNFGGNINPFTINGYNSANTSVEINSWNGSGTSSPGTEISSIDLTPRNYGIGELQAATGISATYYGGNPAFIQAAEFQTAGIGGSDVPQTFGGYGYIVDDGSGNVTGGVDGFNRPPAFFEQTALGDTITEDDNGSSGKIVSILDDQDMVVSPALTTDANDTFHVTKPYLNIGPILHSSDLYVDPVTGYTGVKNYNPVYPLDVAGDVNLTGCLRISTVCQTFASFAYPFTPMTNYGATNQATTGIAWFQNGLNASSTSHFTNLVATAASSVDSALTVASSTGAVEFQIDRYGHKITGGQKPTCGAGCSSVVGDDQTFRTITGTGVTAVTVNFAHTYTNTPVCIASDESGGTTVSDASSTPATVVLNLSASLTTKSIGVVCQISNNFTQ